MKSSKYSFPWKSSLIRGIFLLLKNFLIIASKLLTFLLYELIYMLFGKNKLVWKLQFRYIGLLVEISVSPVFYCYFYYFDSFHKHCFSLGWDLLLSIFFFFFVNQGGSLSSMVNVSCGIKLESIVPINHINCSSKINIASW